MKKLLILLLLTSCSLFDDDKPKPVEPPTPVDPWACTFNGNFYDGAGNFLWKPVSEGNGKPVVLAPGDRYAFQNIQLVDAAGYRIANIVERTNCCEHNDGRMHWYLSQTCQSLMAAPLPFTVKFQKADGNVDCRTIPNPCDRHD